MKFRIARREKRNIYQWHRHFAWWPIFDRWATTRVTMVWLETIERRRLTTGYDPGCETVERWEYRPLSGD